MFHDLLRVVRGHFYQCPCRYYRHELESDKYRIRESIIQIPEQSK
jgi:hypothetical protein